MFNFWICLVCSCCIPQCDARSRCDLFILLRFAVLFWLSFLKSFLSVFLCLLYSACLLWWPWRLLWSLNNFKLLLLCSILWLSAHLFLQLKNFRKKCLLLVVHLILYPYHLTPDVFSFHQGLFRYQNSLLQVKDQLGIWGRLVL